MYLSLASELRSQRQDYMEDMAKEEEDTQREEEDGNNKGC